MSSKFRMAVLALPLVLASQTACSGETPQTVSAKQYFETLLFPPGTEVPEGTDLFNPAKTGNAVAKTYCTLSGTIDLGHVGLLKKAFGGIDVRAVSLSDLPAEAGRTSDEALALFIHGKAMEAAQEELDENAPSPENVTVTCSAERPKL